jgi:hypothetical protein
MGHTRLLDRAELWTGFKRRIYHVCATLSERNISADLVMKSRPSPAAALLFVAACAMVILTPYATSAAPDV